MNLNSFKEYFEWKYFCWVFLICLSSTLIMAHWANPKYYMWCTNIVSQINSMPYGRNEKSCKYCYDSILSFFIYYFVIKHSFKPNLDSSVPKNRFLPHTCLNFEFERSTLDIWIVLNLLVPANSREIDSKLTETPGTIEFDSVKKTNEI